MQFNEGFPMYMCAYSRITLLKSCFIHSDAKLDLKNMRKNTQCLLVQSMAKECHGEPTLQNEY